MIPQDLSNCIWRKDRPSFGVAIKSLTGSICHIEVSDGMTVNALKLKICQKVGIPVDQQRLIFSGKQLEDDKLLQEYKIDSESTVYYIERCRGGGECTMASNQNIAVGAVTAGTNVPSELRAKYENRSPSLLFRLSV